LANALANHRAWRDICSTPGQAERGEAARAETRLESFR
jgi:hypothetical protein